MACCGRRLCLKHPSRQTGLHLVCRDRDGLAGFATGAGPPKNPLRLEALFPPFAARIVSRRRREEVRAAGARSGRARQREPRGRRVGGAERDRGFRLRQSLRDRQPRGSNRGPTPHTTRLTRLEALFPPFAARIVSRRRREEVRAAGARSGRARQREPRGRRVGGAERDRGFRLRQSLRDRQPRGSNRGPTPHTTRLTRLEALFPPFAARIVSRRRREEVRAAGARSGRARQREPRGRRVGGAERDRGFRLRQSLRDRQPRGSNRGPTPHTTRLTRLEALFPPFAARIVSRRRREEVRAAGARSGRARQREPRGRRVGGAERDRTVTPRCARVTDPSASLVRGAHGAPRTPHGRRFDPALASRGSEAKSIGWS